MAVEKDIVDKSGAWYSYKEDRIGQGRENAKIYMANLLYLLGQPLLHQCHKLL